MAIMLAAPLGGRSHDLCGAPIRRSGNGTALNGLWRKLVVVQRSDRQPPRSFPAARLDRPLARRSLTLDPARPQHPRTGKAADHKRTTAMVLTPAQRAQLLAGVGLLSGAGEDGRA
jgi:hypothetical protein